MQKTCLLKDMKFQLFKVNTFVINATNCRINKDFKNLRNYIGFEGY